jgi:hypothetical protein
MSSAACMRIRFFDALRGEPTLLMSGDDRALEKLADFFSALRPGLYEPEREGIFCDRPSLDLLIDVGESATGLRVEPGARKLRWGITRSDAVRFAELIRGLARTARGHQYLECGALDQVIALVSKGEYDDLFVDELEP